MSYTKADYAETEGSGTDFISCPNRWSMSSWAERTRL